MDPITDIASAHPADVPDLHQALLQVGQRALHEAAGVLEVRQQRRPQALLRQHARVAEDHHAVLGTCEGDIQPPRVAQEPYTLPQPRSIVRQRVQYSMPFCYLSG